MQCANRDRSVCPCNATMFVSLFFDALPRLRHCPRHGMLGADQVRGSMHNHELRRGRLASYLHCLFWKHDDRQMKILVLNSGSSSQKACLCEIGDALPESPPSPLWEGRIEWNGDTTAITFRNSKGITRKEKLKSLPCELVLKDLLATLWSGDTRSIASQAEINAVGHRVVHGGPRFHDPILIKNDVYSTLAGLSRFAPLHILFTAGIGESSPEVRAATCKGLDFLGVAIDLNRNNIRMHCSMQISRAPIPA